MPVSTFTNDNSYYNSSDFVISDYYTKSNINSFNYYNSTDFDYNDYYLNSNPYGFYNSTTIGGIVNSSYYVPYTGSNANVVLGNYNFSVGTSDLFVNSNTGNVGIGTTSPASPLEVLKTDTVINTISNVGLFYHDGGTATVGFGARDRKSVV